jgi:glycosyltransferase involved in cell wall biosynthesis
MNNQEMEHRKGSIKSKIESLIENGYLNEAKEAISKYEAKEPGDLDICSMNAVIHIVEGNLDEAEKVLLEGLKKDSVHFDLLYNLAYIYEQRGRLHEAADLYYKAGTAVKNDTQRSSVDDAMDRLKISDSSIQVHEKDRIVFFVEAGMDSFLSDIIQGLSDDYFVRKIVVTDLKQIDEGMEWADICWFEWCDELVIYGSRLPAASKKKVVCRLHSYEAFTSYIFQVAWINVDEIIFVAEHIRQYVLSECCNIDAAKTVVIPNGIDVSRYSFTKRDKGYKIAYVGYINYKKGPMLLLHTFKAIHDRDERYKLYIAGKYQDPRYELYFSQMAEELGIAQSIFFEGWQNDISGWLKDKNYIICTSVLEGNPIGLMEAMSSGIKPIIHNFVGARNMYPAEYIWNTIEEAVSMIVDDRYESKDYRDYIVNNYSLRKQLNNIVNLIEKHLDQYKVIGKVNKILSGLIKPEDAKMRDTTMLIPTYNRAAMVKQDLDLAFNFPSVPKLFIDDCSDENNKKILKSLGDNKEYGIINFVFKEKNGGVADSLRVGVKNIKSKYIITKGDDDLLIYNKSTEDMDEMISCIGVDFPLITSRYLVNMKENNELSIGYDKKIINNCAASQLLKQLFVTGELFGINAGAIYSREDMIRCMPENIFKVSEDYVLTSRILSIHMDLKIKVSEDISYIRRLTNGSLSRKIDEVKLTQHLISMMISGFYCLKAGLINRYDFDKAFISREELLSTLYNYRAGMADTIIDYSMQKIDLETFVNRLGILGLNISDISDLPYEIIHLPEIMI